MIAAMVSWWMPSFLFVVVVSAVCVVVANDVADAIAADTADYVAAIGVANARFGCYSY